MAILNYANTYNEVKDYINVSSNTSDYLKLLFTGDGHIITHGLDYTPDFSPEQRGLVTVSSGRKIDFLRANNTWHPITVEDLPISQALDGTVDNTTIPTSKAIFDYVGGFIKVAETLRFKGIINYINGDYQTVTSDSTTNEFPQLCEIGDTYRIGNVEGSATFAGALCEPGDMLICIKNNTSTNISTNNGEYWSVIQTNINGTKKTTINGVENYFYATANDPIEFFAPQKVGNKGNVLVSIGKDAPIWGNLTFIDGNLVIIDESDEIQLTVQVSASSLVNSLTAGVGLTYNTESDTFNGSTASTLNLMKATTTSLGGIKIDSDHGIEGGATVSVDYDGTIYITAENIKNALGYDVANIHGVVNTEADGLAPRITNTNGMMTNEYYVLASRNGEENPDWYQLSASVFQDTWRDIQVNGESMATKALNINHSDDIFVREEELENIVNLSFGISWYNISAGAYETAEY